MIYYRTIWDTSKNFGAAINHEMELIPNLYDWVVLMDGDTMFLTDFWGKQIEEIIRLNENNYQVIGSMLSRCSCPDQLVDKYISSNYDILYHRGIAQRRSSRFYNDVKLTNGPIAAACMMFQKSTWEKNPFVENTVHFDSIFCNEVKENGGILGIAMGLYLMHAYRPGIEIMPGKHYSHLIK
jgi:cellulose synthase/poly-beta-1,6-N-acetylglucosamine synthase-like glycosyltransferase